MKKIGMVGGLSWQSTVDYYKIINEESNKRLGNKSTVESIIWSTDLETKFNHVINGELDILSAEFIEIVKGLKSAGADMALLCTNTMHIAFDDIQKNVDIPLIHIADATGKAIRDAGCTKVALLGTGYTCSDPRILMDRLKNDFGVECVVPTSQEQREIQRVIEEELTFNIIKDSSREFYVQVIERLAKEAGAQGVILGCTEIQMLIAQKDVSVPVFDTTLLHALMAVDMALED